VTDLLGDDPGRIRGRHVPDLSDELLNLLWLKDQASERDEEKQEREQSEHAKERDRPGDVHQLVLDEPCFESEEEFLPGHSIGWREHGRPFDDPVRLNMERLFVSRIVARTSACRFVRIPGSSTEKETSRTLFGCLKLTVCPGDVTDHEIPDAFTRPFDGPAWCC